MISSQTGNGCRHAVERSHRKSDEAARPARAHDRGSGGQHGEGGANPQYHSAEHVDLLIIRGSGPIADPRYDFEFLFDDSYVVAAGAQNQWVRRRRIEIAELVNELRVLPPPDSVIGSIVMDAFRASGLDYPRVSVVTDCPHMRISLLVTGRFVTIFPASAFRFLAKRSELKILPVELPTALRPNGIVTLKNRALSPVAKLFIDCAREVAKPLARRKR